MSSKSISTERLMRKRSARIAGLAAGAAGVTLLSSCGGSHHVKAAPPTTTSTTVPATTTTTVPPVYPLTGLPAADANQLQAPAVVVKIDNVDQARPQTGIGSADVVYEEMVEGGLTRLAAIFQSSYPTTVGPVRSGRITDEGIGDDLNHPVFVMSGTNANFLVQLRAQPWTDVDGGNHGDQFWRGPGAAPHNEYTNVASVAKLDSVHQPPSPLFQYRATGTPLTGAGAASASHLGIGFSGASIAWDFNPQTGLWMRGQNGTADVDSAHNQLAATNVVVLFVSYYTSGIVAGEGVGPQPIPAGTMTGTGVAWFLSGNQIVKGSWTRPSLTSVATYADTAGGPITLAPGKTWVELVPAGTVPALIP
jgi:hypothetical protein